MAPSQLPQLVIRPALPGQAPELLAWLLFDRPLSQAEIPSGHLLEACQEGQRVGALWLNVSPGRVASLIGPRTVGEHGREVGLQLLQEASELLTAEGVRIAQAPLPIEAEAEMGLYQAAGFPHVLELDYLVSPVKRVRRRAPREASSGVRFVAYEPELGNRFQQIVAGTYQDSQDCPVLNGVRDVRDVLDGYRGQGISADRWWRLLQHDGQDAGCLILADHPPADQMELVYLGILPEFRGRGLGLAATRQALGMAAEGGRARLTLAVDVKNGPAQVLYRRAGFLRWDRKRVLLRFF